MHQAWNLMVKDWEFWLHEQHDDCFLPLCIQIEGHGESTIRKATSSFQHDFFFSLFKLFLCVLSSIYNESNLIPFENAISMSIRFLFFCTTYWLTPKPWLVALHVQVQKQGSCTRLMVLIDTMCISMWTFNQSRVSTQCFRYSLYFLWNKQFLLFLILGL